VAGETVPPELQGELISLGLVAQDSYGMTETMPVGILEPMVAHGEEPPLGSCGRPVPELCELALLDPDTGERVTEPGVVGEVCVRGDVVSPGYFNDPERTADAFEADGCTPATSPGATPRWRGCWTSTASRIWNAGSVPGYTGSSRRYRAPCPSAPRT
jgi:acyl-CoA synthetase (AMP-forming)/AMP-acid ligase II